MSTFLLPLIKIQGARTHTYKSRTRFPSIHRTLQVSHIFFEKISPSPPLFFGAAKPDLTSRRHDVVLLLSYYSGQADANT